MIDSFMHSAQDAALWWMATRDSTRSTSHDNEIGSVWSLDTYAGLPGFARQVLRVAIFSMITGWIDRSVDVGNDQAPISGSCQQGHSTSFDHLRSASADGMPSKDHRNITSMTKVCRCL